MSHQKIAVSEVVRDEVGRNPTILFTKEPFQRDRFRVKQLQLSKLDPDQWCFLTTLVN